MLRVIAGKHKRIQLLTLDSLDTRPTKDMVREALFSSIDVEDKNFLDLFSGSGAIGIEALSRGASNVVFNDINKEAVKIIKSNLNKINEEALILNDDYKNALKTLNGNTFDYIYIDPPYAFEYYEDIFKLINDYNLLSDKGRIIVEVRKDVDLKSSYNNLINYKEKKYGIAKLLYFKRS